MRKRYIQDPVTLELVPADEYVRQDVNAPMVMTDIQPYQSMIDGSQITSRSHHRAHLKQHGCIEIGNEVKSLKAQYQAPKPPPGLKETLIQAAHQYLR